MAPSLRSLPPPIKKRKIAEDSQNDNHSRIIQDLESKITYGVENNRSLNPLADLLEFARTANDAPTMLKAIYALYRGFVTIIASGKLASGGDEAAKAVRGWIWEQLNTYVEVLSGLLKDTEKTLRSSSLQIMFSLLKHLSTSLTVSSATASTKPSPQFHTSHFKHIVSALLICPISCRSTSATKKPKLSNETEENDGCLEVDVRDLFVETWFSAHDDIRWFFLRESATLLASHSAKSHPHLADNLLSILERLKTFPTEPSELNEWWVSELGAKPPKPKGTKSGMNEDDDASDLEEPSMDADTADDDWRKYFDEPSPSDKANLGTKKNVVAGARLHRLTVHQSLHSLASHRAVFTRAWLTLLPRLTVGGDADPRAKAVRALQVMHRGVLPHLTRPVLVMDWIGGAVDYGGTPGLLALNALFVLMKEYNLDYPSFYTRLYAFMDRDVLHLKHRARFFRLTELFLSSTHIPATLLASFAKRLARLSLTAPPAAVVMLVPFTYNILKRHPALMGMIHRIPSDEDVIVDPYDPNEPDPTHTNALQSSLWELHTHTRHYHAPAATLARITEQPFTKPWYTMEDFLDHSYGTMFEAEARKRMKKEPAVETDLPKHVFPLTSVEMDDEAATIGQDVVSQFWTFGA